MLFTHYLVSTQLVVMLLLRLSSFLHTKVLDLYSLQVVLQRQQQLYLQYLLYCTISLLLHSLLVILIGSVGMHLKLLVDYLVSVVVLKQGHTHILRHHMISGLILIGVSLVMHIIQSMMLLTMVLLQRYKQKVKRVGELYGGTIPLVLVTHHRLLVLQTTTLLKMELLDSHMDTLHLVLVVNHSSLVTLVVLDLYSLQQVLVNVSLLLSLVRTHHLEILVVLVLLLEPRYSLDLVIFLPLVVLLSVGHTITIYPPLWMLALNSMVLSQTVLQLLMTMVLLMRFSMVVNMIMVRSSTVSIPTVRQANTQLVVMQLVDLLEHLIKVLDLYSLLVVQQKLLQWITRQLVSSTSSLHLSLSVTPMHSAGVTQDLVLSTHLVVLLNLEHGIIVIPYQLPRQVQTMV